MRQKRQSWQIGDLFCIPTTDAKLALGQIIGQEPGVLNSVTIALFDERYEALPEVRKGHHASSKSLYSVLFTTRDLLDSGHWPVAGKAEIEISKDLYPYEHLRGEGFVGAKVIGSGIVNKFVNAYYGLTPWDDWKDPYYLDQLLLSPQKKPVERLLLKKPE